MKRFPIYSGVRGEIRTLDRSLRRRLLYPTELREQILGQIDYNISSKRIQELYEDIFIIKQKRKDYVLKFETFSPFTRKLTFSIFNVSFKDKAIEYSTSSKILFS